MTRKPTPRAAVYLLLGVVVALIVAALVDAALDNDAPALDRTDPRVQDAARIFYSENVRHEIVRHARRTGDSTAVVVCKLAHMLRHANEAELGAIRAQGVFPRDDSINIDPTADAEEMADQLLAEFGLQSAQRAAAKGGREKACPEF